MEAAVLDTDVISFIAKGDTRASFYLPDLADKRWCVCFQTVAELRLWEALRRWGPVRRKAVEGLLRHFVVLPYDSKMAQHWADVIARRRRSGRPIECGDAWIAAAALRHDASLLTHNAADYVDIPDLKVISHRK